MPTRIWLLVPLAYLLARLGCRRLVAGTWAITDEILVQMLLVPIVQLVALAALRRFPSRKLQGS